MLFSHPKHRTILEVNLRLKTAGMLMKSKKKVRFGSFLKEICTERKTEAAICLPLSQNAGCHAYPVVSISVTGMQ